MGSYNRISARATQAQTRSPGIADFILWVLRVVGQWRNLPTEGCPKWQLVYYYFWRWVSERTFGTFNFFRRLFKDHEKTTLSSEAWFYWQYCQLIINRKI